MAKPVAVYHLLGKTDEGRRLFRYRGLEPRFKVAVLSDNYSMSAPRDLPTRDTARLPGWPQALSDEEIDHSFLLINQRAYHLAAGVIPDEIALVRSGDREYLACLYQNHNAMGTFWRQSWGHFIEVRGDVPQMDRPITGEYFSLNLLRDHNADGLLDLPVVAPAPCAMCRLPDTCSADLDGTACAYVELRSLSPTGWQRPVQQAVLCTVLYQNSGYPQIKPLRPR